MMLTSKRQTGWNSVVDRMIALEQSGWHLLRMWVGYSGKRERQGSLFLQLRSQFGVIYWEEKSGQKVYDIRIPRNASQKPHQRCKEVFEIFFMEDVFFL